MTALRGVIFDLGGTLVTPVGFEEQKIAHLLQWAAARGLPVGPEAALVVREARHWMWNETFASGCQYTTPQAIARAAPQLDVTIPGLTNGTQRPRVPSSPMSRPLHLPRWYTSYVAGWAEGPSFFQQGFQAIQGWVFGPFRRSKNSRTRWLNSCGCSMFTMCAAPGI